MVVEIPYEKYKLFCSNLPSKDVFYYLKSLFVKFENNEIIYAVKYGVNQNPNKLYKTLLEKNQIQVMTISDFSSELPTSESNAALKEEKYRDKNLLIVV